MNSEEVSSTSRSFMAQEDVKMTVQADPLHMLEPTIKQREEWNRELEHKEVMHPRQWYVWLELFQHYPYIVALGVGFYRSLRTMWKIKSKKWPVSTWGIGEVEPWLSIPLPSVTRDQILYRDRTPLRELVDDNCDDDDDDGTSDDQHSFKSSASGSVVEETNVTRSKGASSRKIRDASPKVLGAIGWVPKPYEETARENDEGGRENYEVGLGLWLLNAVRHQKNCAVVFLRSLPPGYFNLDSQVTDKKSTAMVLAAQDNFCLGVLEMLRVGAGLNFPRADGFTPLHAAAYWDAPEATQLLVAQKADQTLANNDHELPIQSAAHLTNSAHCLKILLDGGSKVDAFKSVQWKMTPLHIACRSNSVVCIKVLLEYGANLLQRDVENWWGAHYAVCNGHIETLDFIRQDLDVDLVKVEEDHMRRTHGAEGTNFFLMGCAHRSGVAALKWLLTHYPEKKFIKRGCSKLGEDPNKVDPAQLENPLFAAVCHGNLPAMQFLLDEDADTLRASGGDDLTPFQGLRYISAGKREEATKLLVSHPNSQVKEKLRKFAPCAEWDLHDVSNANFDRERQGYAIEIIRLSRFNPKLVEFFIDDCGINPCFAYSAKQIPALLRNCADLPLASNLQGIATFLCSRGVDINSRDYTCGPEAPTVLDILLKNLSKSAPSSSEGEVEKSRIREFLALGAVKACVLASS